MSKAAVNLTAKGLADAAMIVLLLLFTVFQTAGDTAYGRIGMGMAAPDAPARHGLAAISKAPGGPAAAGQGRP